MIVFKELCMFFHQDVSDIFDSPEAALSMFVRNLKQSEKIDLVDFLTLKLQELSTSELEKLWHDCGSDIIIYDDGIRELFKYIIKIQKRGPGRRFYLILSKKP